MLLDEKDELKSFILLVEESIKKEITKGAIKKAKVKTQRRENVKIQKSIITNALNLFDKRTIVINAFATKSICPGDLEEDVYHQDEEPKFEPMLHILLIFLAQLEAENNSEKT